MSSSIQSTQRALVELSSSMPVHRPGTPEYDAAVTPWNRAVTLRPIAVVDARSEHDVTSAVRFAQQHRLQVSVQATGHGATADLDGVLLISTRNMRGLQIHAEAAWARAEAGVTWTQVLEAGAPHGLAGLAGSAPGVGVVGYTTGGGLGPLARTHGLAADLVRAFEVVTGDGRLRRVTATEHPDLFWGLRGGRGMLGIVTAVEFDLLPVSEIYGGAVYFGGRDAPAVLRRWAEWCPGLPAEATTSIALLRLPDLPSVPPPLAGRLSVAVRFAWTGPAERGADVLGPIRSVATPVVDTVATMPYAALGTIHADPVDPMPAHEESGLLRELPPTAVERLLEVAGPDASCPQTVVELRQLGGAIATGGPMPSVFPAREAAFSLLTIGSGFPPLADAVRAHGRTVLAAMQPWEHPGAVPTFAPRPGVAWLHRAYGPARLKRLRRIDAAHDPHGVLFGAMALRASMQSASAWNRRGLRSLLPLR